MATYFNIDGYNSYSGCDAIVTAQLANIDGNSAISNNCYTLGSLQTLSTSTHQDKVPVRNIGNINAIDYTMGQRTIAGTMVFAVFDRHFADEIFKDLREYTNNTIILADEIPALNLTITLANEYGSKSRMALYGLKFVDEGQVLSINDLYTENTFQFVAVGLDPLTAEERTWAKNKHDKKTNKTYISTGNIPFESYDGTSYHGGSKNPTGGGEIPGDISNTNQYIPEDNKVEPPYYKINQPITEDGKGILTIDMSNSPDTQVIITNLNTNETYSSFDTNLKNNIWYIELDGGNYNIKFFNTRNNQEFGSELFSIGTNYDETSALNDNYPIITNMTHDSADIESNVSKHDKAILIDRTSQKKYEPIPLSRGTLTLDENSLGENLNNKNVYELYTLDSKIGPSSKSKSIIFSPLEKEDYDVELLENYIKCNKKLWVNDLDKFDFDKLYSIKESKNLIDKILEAPIDDESVKQEMLIYAIKLQNELSLVYNNSIAKNFISNNNILNLDIKINDTLSRINLYKIKNNKAYYMYSLDGKTDMKISGTPNTRYYLQPIFNQYKGVSYNYCCFSSDMKDELKEYSDINNIYEFNVDEYKKRYPKYSDEFLYALIACDNFYFDKYIINGPYCYYKNNLLYADVDYSEALQEGDYYLCIASVNEVLDHTPIRKCKFNTSDKNLVLDNYKTSIIKDKYYLVWIEDEDFNSICIPTILCTYKDNSDLLDYESTCIKEYLKNRIKAMKARCSYSSVLDSIYLSLISETLPFKNVMHRLHQEVINQFDDSPYYLYLDYVLYELIRLDYEIANINCTVQQKNKAFSFNTKMNDTHLVLIDYKIGEDLPVKSTIYDTNSVDLTNRDSDYTMVYMLDKFMYNRSGFLLINNSTGKVYNYNISLEVIE